MRRYNKRKPLKFSRNSLLICAITFNRLFLVCITISRLWPVGRCADETYSCVWQTFYRERAHTYLRAIRVCTKRFIFPRLIAISFLLRFPFLSGRRYTWFNNYILIRCVRIGFRFNLWHSGLFFYTTRRGRNRFVNITNAHTLSTRQWSFFLDRRGASALSFVLRNK